MVKSMPQQSANRFGKKGIFFTILAIFFLSLLMMSFSFYTDYVLRTKSLVIETRINTMEDFIRTLDVDFKRSLYISSHRSILSLIQHITTTGNFSKNVSYDFNELIIRGTLNATPQELMENTTLLNWTDKMKLESRAIDILVDFNIKTIEITMLDPWSINVKLTTDIFVSDPLGIATWNMTKDIITQVSILGFEDPTYALNTQGKILNTINKTPYTTFVSGTNMANLNNHNANSYYLEWSMAPDFLQRLNGNLTSTSANGIESLINLDELTTQGIAIEERSVVDHIYWTDKIVNSYAINNTPSWFRMDDELNTEQNKTHLQLYQVNESVI